jgi:hypothetical protein
LIILLHAGPAHVFGEKCFHLCLVLPDRRVLFHLHFEHLIDRLVQEIIHVHQVQERFRRGAMGRVARPNDFHLAEPNNDHQRAQEQFHDRHLRERARLGKKSHPESRQTARDLTVAGAITQIRFRDAR